MNSSFDSGMNSMSSMKNTANISALTDEQCDKKLNKIVFLND